MYGLTSATFDNPFRNPKNANNIVALRGALFMRTLQDEVQQRGFTVAHIKTDSIKIPGATPEIIDFCMKFAEKYGYQFEHEATYEKMCLVNNAVYIARYMDAADCKARYGYVPGDNEKEGGEWTATGTQFQVPYVFKTLFSHEDIVFNDLCETKSVSKGAIYLDKNEDLAEGEHNYIFVGRVGQFCPIKPGCGGALLVREAGAKDNGETKYDSVTGAKDYRWLESEMVYADFSNELKALARKARKEAANMKGLVYSPAAAKEYRAEVDSINAKLESVIANKPKERRAMVIANANIKAKIQALDLDPKLDKKEIKKISSVEMQRARDSIGASGSKTRITFTDREWEAVQKGAISDSKLTKILNASKSDEIVKRAMPKTATVITNAKMAKAKAMLANGYTYNEIAKACGVPESTVYSALNK